MKQGYLSKIKVFIKADDRFNVHISDVVFKDKVFVLTGIFTIADRKEIVKMILEREGITAKATISKVDYLVIG